MAIQVMLYFLLHSIKLLNIKVIYYIEELIILAIPERTSVKNSWAYCKIKFQVFIR